MALTRLVVSDRPLLPLRRACSAFPNPAEHRLEVEDRSPIESFEAADPDARSPGDLEDRDPVEADRVGAVRRARAEDSGERRVLIVARMEPPTGW